MATSLSKYYVNEKSSFDKDYFEGNKGDESFRFHQSVKGYKPTPIVQLKSLAQQFQVSKISVKDESNRFGLDAFKALGPSFAMHKISRQLQADLYCTATDGNHGRSVAWYATTMGAKAHIFLPGHTIPERVKAIRNEGGEAIVINGSYDDATVAARRFAQKTGAALIQDSSWPGYNKVPSLIMNGYMTIMHEIYQLNQLQGVEPDLVLLQAGVGSFAAAIVWYYVNNIHKGKTPTFVIVEPNGAACCMAAAEANQVITIDDDPNTVMAGLNCGTISEIAFQILKAHADCFIAIPDYYAESAMKELYKAGISSGASGASGLGGLMAIMLDPYLRSCREWLDLGADSHVLCFITEGPTDPKHFKRLTHSW